MERNEERIHFTMAFVGGCLGVYALLHFANLFGSAQTSNLIAIVTSLLGGNLAEFGQRVGGTLLYMAAIALTVYLPRRMALDLRFVSLAIDALAARSVHRLCSTVQLADTGIIPGSGVGNARAALNRETLGVPVIAIGVPTVVDAATLAADLTGREPEGELGSLLVTPKDIDVLVSDVAKVIGYGVNLALQPGLTVEDVELFLS